MSAATEHGRVRRALARLRNLARPNVTITPPPSSGVVFERDVAVEARDGVTLRVNVFRPDDDAPHPVLLCAHPYGKDDLPPARGRGYAPAVQFRIMPQSVPVRFSAWTGWEAPDPGAWVPRGYVVINADLRGWGHSDGTGSLLDLDQDGRDGHDLVEWAAAQPWSNGRVGMTGVSYLAITQWATAAQRPPHLAAICPWEGFTDAYRHFARPGGVREDGFVVLWSRMAQRRARSLANAHVGLRDQQLRRTAYDEWWATRSVDVSAADVPALVCGSFSDHNLHSAGSFEGFERLGSSQKWLFTHRGPKWATYYGAEAQAAQQRFFDHFLTGADNGQERVPAVRLEVREDADTVTSVRETTAWPPPETTLQRWALSADGTLGPGAPGEVGEIAVDAQRGTASFTYTFERDTELVGPMRLRLSVEARSGDDLAVFAGVRKVRDGVLVPFECSYGFRGSLLTFGLRRLDHRCGDREDEIAPPEPGAVVELDVTLRPSATLFRAGEQLRLDLRGRWFYGRFPLTGPFPAGYRPSGPGRFVVHTGPGRPSWLEVPVQPGA